MFQEKHKIEKQQLLAEIQLKFQEREKAFEFLGLFLVVFRLPAMPTDHEGVKGNWVEEL